MPPLLLPLLSLLLMSLLPLPLQRRRGSLPCPRGRLTTTSAREETPSKRRGAPSWRRRRQKLLPGKKRRRSSRRKGRRRGPLLPPFLRLRLPLPGPGRRRLKRLRLRARKRFSSSWYEQQQTFHNLSSCVSWKKKKVFFFHYKSIHSGPLPFPAFSQNITNHHALSPLFLNPGVLLLL